MRATVDDHDSDDGSGDERGGEGNVSKISLILLLVLFTAISIARSIQPMTRSMRSNAISSDNIRVVATTAGIPTSSNNTSTSPPNTNRSVGPEINSQELTRQSLPIYLFQSSTNRTARTTWGTLAKQWNRTAQYTHLFESSTLIPSLPSSKRTLQRRVVMIHCGPKTGSTTLRMACKSNLEKTCNIHEKSRYPAGYMDEGKLYPLIRRCANTSHFCAKEVVMPTIDDVPTYDNLLFVHMIPFRNYDEWAVSALKQQYDHGREKGCNKTKSLLEKCEPSRMEIDFRKYGKTALSKFKEGVVHRMTSDEDKGESHVFLLYHHRELNSVLENLSGVYGIPSLPGSDGKQKEKRPEGTCDAGLLQMFHDCYSSELMELI